VSTKKKPEYSLADALAELFAVIESGSILDAEVQVAGMLAVPVLNGSTRAAAESYVGGLISGAARMRPRSSAAAFCRLLMALGSPAVKKMASGALRELTASGVYPPGWVTQVARPVPDEAWLRSDVFGDDEVVAVTFTYPAQEREQARHAVLVRVDRTVLPVATTVGVSPDPDSLVESITKDDPAAGTAQRISLAEARRRIEGPLARAAQTGSRGLAPSSQTFLAVARAHVKRLPEEDDAAGTAVYTAADRAAAVDAFLASQQGSGASAAAGPEVARFWAEALTGYSGRLPGEPPAQVGPRKIAVLLGHVASTFTLTGEQRSGLGPVVTAWAAWAAGRQGLDDAATGHVLEAAAEAIEEFPAAYDSPSAAISRAYADGVSASDADVIAVSEAVTRRAVAVPFPEVTDGQPAMDVADPAARAAMVAAEFASCHLDDGQARPGLVSGATRVVEELWAGTPATTWEAARKLMAEGHTRHDVIHALVAQ
jgi:hypothetical protein